MPTAAAELVIPQSNAPIVHVPNPNLAPSTWLTPSSFEAAERIAGLMAKCGTLPKHLVGQPADCFRIVVQAAKWGMDPFAVAECTALVHGRLSYEGKLVHAVLLAMGTIAEPLDFTYNDKAGEDLEITVTGTLRRSTITKSITGTVKDWKTDNVFWKKMPREMLAYRGTRTWARLYAPQAIMGVVTPDEMEEIRDVEHTVVEPKRAHARSIEALKMADDAALAAADAVKDPERAPLAAKMADAAALAADDAKKAGTPTETKKAPLFTVNDLLVKANQIHDLYKAPGLAAIKGFMDRIGVKQVKDCPPEKAEAAMEILKAFERELAEGGAK